MRINIQSIILISISLSIVVLLAGFFRFTGINWDKNQYLHPDERFIVMVISNMSWPKNIQTYFNTDTSTLNPHNIGHSFFVYGTWPLILMKFVSQLFNKTMYGDMHLVIRPLSGFIDILSVIFIYVTTGRLIKKIFPQIKLRGFIISATLASSVYATMLLPIQLSHFATVDPYVNLTITFILFLLTFQPSILTSSLLGISMGLGIGAKISTVLIIIPIGIYYTYFFYTLIKKKYFTHILIYSFFLLFFLFCSFRISMPYFFANGSLIVINEKVSNNIKELQGYMKPDIWFPPSVQWIHTPSIIYPAVQLLFWGLGIPFSILLVLSLAKTTIYFFKRRTAKNSEILKTILILFSTISVFFFYQGIQFALPQRYFWPLLPPISMFIGVAGGIIYTQKRNLFWTICIFICFVCNLLWSISYLSIYTKQHTRVTASEWIYNSIPTSATLSSEHWDDGLPLNLDSIGVNSQYTTIELEMYAPDTEDKWIQIKNKLEQIDYLILSSNRVYGSITSAPDKYPQSVDFYYKLWTDQTEFKPIIQFTSRPTLPIPYIHTCIQIPFFSYGRIDTFADKQLDEQCEGLVFIDDYADETWTVYDHPKVTIFKNILRSQF